MFYSRSQKSVYRALRSMRLGQLPMITVRIWALLLKKCPFLGDRNRCG
jgi:hypothetical protein